MWGDISKNIYLQFTTVFQRIHSLLLHVLGRFAFSNEKMTFWRVYIPLNLIK